MKLLQSRQALLVWIFLTGVAFSQAGPIVNTDADQDDVMDKLDEVLEEIEDLKDRTVFHTGGCISSNQLETILNARVDGLTKQIQALDQKLSGTVNDVFQKEKATLGKRETQEKGGESQHFDLLDVRRLSYRGSADIGQLVRNAYVFPKLTQEQPECEKDSSKGSEYFDLMGTCKREWRLAFRGTANIGRPVYDAYINRKQDQNVEPGCKQMNGSLPCTHHFSTDVLNNWVDIKEVAFVLYKKGVIQKKIIFDATDSNYITWFDQKRVIQSSWLDLKAEPTNYFSIAGHVKSYHYRRFYINRRYQGCPKDDGWFAAIDMRDELCPWAKVQSIPTFLYSKGTGFINWTTGDVDSADVMAIFVKYN